MDKLQLRDGGRYKLRNGEIITVSPNAYRWMGSNDSTYTNDGKYRAVGGPSDIDIVAEVPEEKETTMDWTFEVGKYYLGSDTLKWKCEAISGNAAFITSGRDLAAIVLISSRMFMHASMSITGPWVEPLVIRWDCLAPECDHVEINADYVYAYYGNKPHNSFSDYAADFYAPGWREHIGETHYRNGRSE